MTLQNPVRVTQCPEADEQLLYFTSSSLLSDDRHLVFLSNRTGAPNIFLRDTLTGGETQLSNNAEGYLKSYVYFDGTPYRGLGKASVSVDTNGGKIYYLQGRQICSVDVYGEHRVLNEYPDGQMTAFSHVSVDGKKLCLPTIDARALDGYQFKSGQHSYDIDERVQAEGLSSYLRIYDTTTGEELETIVVPMAWVTHVQFSPVNSSLILYNHEWPCTERGTRRIWLWDGSTHRKLRDECIERPTVSSDDWTCHEMWERDGSAIIYHGIYTPETPAVGGRSFIGRVLADGSYLNELALPEGWNRYGHFTVGNPGQLVSDGYFETNDDGAPEAFGAWICKVNINWERRKMEWIPLCRSGSTWDCQCSHPHPILNHSGNTVYFTSDREGYRSAYSVRC